MTDTREQVRDGQVPGEQVPEVPVTSEVTGTFASRWQRYPAYKESGVEWIDEIPTHWQPWKVAHGFRYIGSGTTPSSTNRDYYEGEIPWVNTSELRDGLVQDTAKKLTDEALDDHSSLRVYPAGTLLVALYGATIGKVGILDIPATTNQACCALAEPDGLDSKFTFYWLIAHRQPLIQLGYGGGQQNISQETIRSLRIPAPPLDEQRAIAGFLDRETERIDTLIARKERLIELLQEKRTALISHAVTKGLDPDAPMQDSGVEWLGEVPAHWDITAFKFVAEMRYGLGQPPPELVGGLPLIRATNVERGRISEKDMMYVDPKQVPATREAILSSGEIIVVRSGAYTGDSAIIPPEYDGAVAGYDMVVRIIKGHSHYFAWQLLAPEVYELQFGFHKQRAAQPHLNAEELKGTLVSIPPLSEQRDIASYLDREIGRIDTLAGKIQETIEALREYRTALISATVTGTIDVRGETDGS